MKPYYEEAGIQIFHGDCREILPSIPKVDLVLTDPPYGVGFEYGESYSDTDREYATWIKPIFDLLLTISSVVMLTTGMRNLWLYPPATWVLCWAKPGSPRRSGLGGFNEWEPVLVYGKRRIYNDFRRFPAWNNTTRDAGRGTRARNTPAPSRYPFTCG